MSKIIHSWCVLPRFFVHAVRQGPGPPHGLETTSSEIALLLLTASSFQECFEFGLPSLVFVGRSVMWSAPGWNV